MIKIRKLIIVSDACCRIPEAHVKNRLGKGKAACGVIYLNGEKTAEAIIHKAGKYLGEMTVNEAEYHGLIYAVDEASSHCIGDLEVWLDSELVDRHLTGEYKLKARNLKPLFDKVKSIEKRYESVMYFHHGRENEMARLADKLAIENLDKNI